MGSVHLSETANSQLILFPTLTCPQQPTSLETTALIVLHYENLERLTEN